MQKQKTDLAILGAGPGGYVAAIKAAKMGMDVTVVEKENLGGVCLNWGCMPTKAMAHIAETYHLMKGADEFGISIKDLSLDFKKIMERKNKIVKTLRSGIEFNFKKNKIKLVRGNGTIKDKNTLSVETKEGPLEIEAKNMIIATGSTASNINPFRINNDLVLDNIGILSLSDLPKSLIVIGGGVVGSEFASIFNILGTKVTIVEIMPGILINEDQQVSDLIRDIFKKRDIEVFLDSSVSEIKLSDQVRVKLSDGKELEAEKLLLSVGRVPNTKGIGLENAGIKTDKKGFIQTDANLKTNVGNIYAIGDVIGGYQLAHVASKEGITAVENIAGKDKKINYNAVPWAVFTLPEIGSVGMNESEAKEKGLPVKTGFFPFKSNGKALAIGETEGFVKLVTDSSSDEILGASVIGTRASDIIHEITVAMTGELTSEYLAETIHSHPTLSEAVMEAAEDIFGMAIHKL